MSAWVVDELHIDLLVAAGLNLGTGAGAEPFGWWRVDEAGEFAGWRYLTAYERVDTESKAFYSPSQLGQMLLDENVASVAYRYSEPGRTYYYGPESAAALTAADETDYSEPLLYEYRDPGRRLSPGQVFKAIDCLDYQSCEHPTWRTSEAYACLRNLRDGYCQRVAGYEEAPYGFSGKRGARAA